MNNSFKSSNYLFGILSSYMLGDCRMILPDFLSLSTFPTTAMFAPSTDGQSIVTNRLTSAYRYCLHLTPFTATCRLKPEHQTSPASSYPSSLPDSYIGCWVATSNLTHMWPPLLHPYSYMMGSAAASNLSLR